MLHRLSIRNYAIIDKLDIEFSDRMNIITGETGAGKSILVGALNLILGERADIKMLYNENEKCIVEAHFEIEDKGLQTFFSDNELDFDTHTIVRREISPSGKSRAFINDTPVTLLVLKTFGEKLVNLHSQHETLDLTEAGFQMNVIDTIAGNAAILEQYKADFKVYKQKQKDLENLRLQSSAAKAEHDFLLFQLKELTDANLISDEQRSLEDEQSSLEHVEEIKRVLQECGNILNREEPSLLDMLNEVISRLKPVKSVNRELSSIDSRIHSVYEELKDIVREIEHLDDATAADPERLEEVTSRLNLIYRLQKKHHADDNEALLQIQQSLEERVSFALHSDENLHKLESEDQNRFSQLLLLAQTLHEQRQKVVDSFRLNVEELLHKVGMPSATFKVELTKLKEEAIRAGGLSDVKYLFSANKGFAPQEIKQVASGGELSRLMLCIKSLIADAGAMTTMIFDEIDSGISGETALKVGEVMKKLSVSHQLIAITHLPQIARIADKHLYIYKEHKDQRSVTRIRTLTGEERVVEIAKMLSGENVSDAALANARELISI